MTEKKSQIMQSVDDYQAFLAGDESKATVDIATVRPIPDFSAAEIKTIRRKNHMTQQMLAHTLLVSPRTVEAWEIGKTRPNGPSKVILSLLDKDPDKFKELLDS